MSRGPAIERESASRDQRAGSARARHVPSVFISYRRSDTRDIVASLATLLRRDLGGDQVFRDEDDLIAGEQWASVIRDRLVSSDAALFVIGGEWEGADGDVRRIDRVDDPVRSEVELALDSACPAIPVPIVVDRSGVPTGPPSCIDELFAHHSVRTTRSDLPPVAGDGYQQVLVGVWAAIRARLDGTMLIIADDAEAGTVAIDAFLRELATQDLPDARELSRFASGAAIVTFDATKKAAQRWPDVVLLVGDGAPSRTMSARIHAVAAHPALKGAALIGLGAISSSAVGLAAQSFRTATDWIAHTNSNAGTLGRRLLRTLQARPRVAAAALLVAAGIGAAALVLSPESRVGASVEHAGLQFAISDTRIGPLPIGTSAERQDPDPGVDHYEVLLRVTNPGVETTGLDFASQTASDVFDLELADGTIITSEGARASEDPYGTTYLPLYEVEDVEFWVSFPIASGAPTTDSRLRIHLGRAVASVVAMDAGDIETKVVPVNVVDTVYEGPYGWGGQNRVRIEVGEVTASFEAGFDADGEPLPSPSFGRRRRAESGWVLVRYEVTETETATNSKYGNSRIGTRQAIVDGEELPDRTAHMYAVDLGPTPATYYGAIEVPLDADTAGIGFTSVGLGEDPVFYVAELDTAFLAEFHQQ